jgi:hypothetical protein
LGPLQYSVPGGPSQGVPGPARPHGCRRCLLKGCERFYRPTHPQSRYCSVPCRLEARRWRRRQASRTWRSSEAGQRCRREQARRYRRRIPLIVLPEPRAMETTTPDPTPVPEAREGQRPGTIPQDFSVRACPRPGCYAVFAVASVWSPRRFCSSACRRALRNVLDREARYRRRRRQGFRPRRRRSRPSPPRPP